MNYTITSQTLPDALLQCGCIKDNFTSTRKITKLERQLHSHKYKNKCIRVFKVNHPNNFKMRFCGLWLWHRKTISQIREKHKEKIIQIQKQRVVQGQPPK